MPAMRTKRVGDVYFGPLERFGCLVLILVCVGGAGLFALWAAFMYQPPTVVTHVDTPPEVLATPGPSPSPILAPSTTETLTVADGHFGTIIPALTYTLPFSATGGGFTETTSVRLFVGGARIYLPIILRNSYIGSASALRKTLSLSLY